MGFVNELLAGEGYRAFNQWDRMMYGDSNMASSSWHSLRRRLTENGFILKMGTFDKNRRQTIEMRFSA
jgi:hypothetical protein